MGEVVVRFSGFLIEGFFFFFEFKREGGVMVGLEVVVFFIVKVMVEVFDRGWGVF